MGLKELKPKEITMSPQKSIIIIGAGLMQVPVTEAAKRMGLKVGSNWIIGYPGESVWTIIKSLRYFKKLDLDSIAIVPCVPFPGTQAWKIANEKGWLTKRAECYSNYWFEIGWVHPLITTPTLSTLQLKAWVVFIYFYLYFFSFKRLSVSLRGVFRKIF